MCNEEKKDKMLGMLIHLVQDSYEEGFYTGRSENVCGHCWNKSEAKRQLENIAEELWG